MRAIPGRHAGVGRRGDGELLSTVSLELGLEAGQGRGESAPDPSGLLGAKDQGSFSWRAGGASPRLPPGRGVPLPGFLHGPLGSPCWSPLSTLTGCGSWRSAALCPFIMVTAHAQCPLGLPGLEATALPSSSLPPFSPSAAACLCRWTNPAQRDEPTDPKSQGSSRPTSSSAWSPWGVRVRGMKEMVLRPQGGGLAFSRPA